MFGSRVAAHAELVPEADPVDVRGSGLVKAAQAAAMAGGGKGGHASAFKINELARYMRQFGNVARADELRHRTTTHSYDVILKARIDVMYQQLVDVAPLWRALARQPRLVFATKMYSMPYSPDYTWPQWRDWNLVVGEPCAAAMSDSASLYNCTLPLYNGSRRCYGFCIEEQLKLQLERRGCVYEPLPWNLTQHRIYHRAADEADAARRARLAVAASQVAAGVRWREEHGLANRTALPQCALSDPRDEQPLLGSSTEAPPTWGR